MSTEFERELRGVFEGRDDVLTRVTRTCSEQESENYYSIQKNPFIVIRAAGSFGIDLVCYRNGIFLPIEEKTSAKKRLWLGSDRHQKQVEGFHDVCRRGSVVPVYAYRLKKQRGDAWRLMTIDGIEPEGRSRLLYDKLPRGSWTPSNRLVLVWDDGIPLNKFIGYLSSIVD